MSPPTSEFHCTPCGWRGELAEWYTAEPDPVCPGCGALCWGYIATRHEVPADGKTYGYSMYATPNRGIVRVRDMTRDELIEAVETLGALFREALERHRSDLAALGR